jgi:hypothetical protein
MRPPNLSPVRKPAQTNEQVFSFLVPKWAIEEYQAIQLEETGKQISEAKATEELLKLIGFYKLVLGDGNDASKQPGRQRKTKSVRMTTYYSEVSNG